ncbi:MAG: hypothetical protein WCV86_04800 [Patescibacteria group bacterium]|jgi:hypothetical protein
MPKNPQTEVETSTKVSLGTKISLGYTIATAVLVLLSVVATAIWTFTGSSAANSGAATTSSAENALEQTGDVPTFSFTTPDAPLQ